MPWNLPNALTLARIFLIPLLLAAMLGGKFELVVGPFLVDEQRLALVIFLGAAITDFLDGYLARRSRQVTTVGKLLDPIADKLLISAAFISLVELGRVPAWVVVLIVGREFAVSGLRYVALSQGTVIAAGPWGKAKMWAQTLAVAFLLIAPGDPLLWQLGYIALTAAVALTVISMWDYFRSFFGGSEEPAVSEAKGRSAAS